MNKVMKAVWSVMMVLVAVSCSDKLDIQQSYEFTIEALPVPKKIEYGEKVEIRCRLVPSGDYENTRYTFRSFQPDGDGELYLNDTLLLLPNDLYELKEKTFKLYYTSKSTEQQTVDVYFFDSFNNSFTLSFDFSNKNKEEDK